MEVTAEQVEQAVIQFYANTTGKPELNTWLTHLQHSNQAWNFAWTLLDRNKVFCSNVYYIFRGLQGRGETPYHRDSIR